MTLNQKIRKIQKDNQNRLNFLSKSKFGTKKHLLWVAMLAYRFVLDQNNCGNPKCCQNRLTSYDKYQLGKNLAKYWNYKK
jgi:hypothetical protein